MHAKLRSALSRLGGADAIVMQSIAGEKFAQCSRSLSGGQSCQRAARVAVEAATLRTEGAEINH